MREAPVDPRILDQMRRVRLRRWVRELQRVTYPVLATIGTGGALATLAALRGGTSVFVGTVAAALAAVGLTLGVVLRSAWRRRVQRGHAALWIDDAAGLRGVLATLLTVRASGPFRDLLAARTLQMLPAWRPERVVPAVVPVVSACTAGVGLAALLIVVALAPRLLPAVPEIVVTNDPLAAVDARGLPTRSDRLVVGRDGSLRGSDGIHDGRPTRAVASGEDGRATSWPTVAQEAVRRSLWGSAWDRVRTELARAEEARARATARARTQPDARLAMREGRSGDEPTVAGDASGTNDAAATPPSPDRATAGSDAPAGSAGSGAGDTTDARFFGPSHDEIHTASDPFALALAARVRTRGQGPRPPSGEAPAAAPDERPDLVARQRREDATQRMAITPQYARIVRALFAHDPRREGEAP
ncbi:MAG: hypothetical protein ACREQL_10445 [Candidatus Binatia bacterium]